MKHQIIINSSGKVTTYKEESKNSILSKLINYPSGRSALAQAMAAPIRRNLDYQGIINNPTFRFSDIKTRRFNIIDRYKNLYRRKIYIR